MNNPLETTFFDKAVKFAVEAHSGTERRGKAYPYIIHPMEAASIVATITNDQEMLAAAILHDTVEDTSVTLEELAEIFPPEVVEAVRLLTHDKNTDYDEYVLAIRDNTIARAVKTADLMHNSDPERLALADIIPEKRKSLAEIYGRAKRLLAGTE